MTGATTKIGQTLNSYTVNSKQWTANGLSARRSKSWFGGDREEGRPHFTAWPDRGKGDDTIEMVEATIDVEGTSAHLQCFTSNCFLKLDIKLPSYKVPAFLAQMNDMEGALRDFLVVSQIMGPNDEPAYMKQLRKLARFMLANKLILPGVRT
ncbi:MAG TPA: hypothetical protein VMT86_01635 [Bryobacteraceae bacterium]|nr:hypothetical protein [Bryobacteraceae bacterium]